MNRRLLTYLRRVLQTLVFFGIFSIFFVGPFVLKESVVKDEITSYQPVSVSDMNGADPHGMFYSITTGRFLPDGSVTVTTPPGGAVTGNGSGSLGSYLWSMTTPNTAGVYSMTITPPPGFTTSATCTPSGVSLDPTGFPNPYYVGSQIALNGYYLDSAGCPAVYYTSFNLVSTDPVVYYNNIPLIPPEFCTGTSITGTAFSDYDVDGALDPGEPGMPSVTILAHTADGFLNACRTNADGSYGFDVTAGTSVRIEAIDFVSSTQPGPYGTDSRTPLFFATSPASGMHIGFVTNTSAVVQFGDRVWNDVDRDGIQDPGEPGIPGVTVNIMNGSEPPTIYGTSTTDVDGRYIFGGINNANVSSSLVYGTTYQIGIRQTDSALSLYSPSPVNQAYDTRDSDLTTAGLPANFFKIIVTSGLLTVNNHTADFGFFTSSSASSVNLVLTKTASITTTTPSSTISYRLSYSNSGTATATGTIITETVPTGTVFSSALSTGTWSCANGAVAGTSCTTTIGSVTTSTSASTTFAVTVLGSYEGMVTNTARITDNGASGADTNTANNTSTLAITVSGDPDLTVTTTADVGATTPGNSISFTISYANTGTIEATSTILTETVPTGTLFSSASSTGTWSCADGSVAGTVCTSTIGVLPISATGTRVFTVTTLGTYEGTVTNTVSIADSGTRGADLNSADNTAVQAVTVSGDPDLSVTNTPNVSSAAAGSTILFTIGYANSGTIQATGTVITETVPVGTTFVSAQSTGSWSCTDGAAAGTSCTLTLGPLAVTSTGSYVFAVTVQSGFSGTVSNVVTIADDGTRGTDMDTSNNTATATVTVPAPATSSPNRGTLPLPPTLPTGTISMAPCIPTSTASLTIHSVRATRIAISNESSFAGIVWQQIRGDTVIIPDWRLLPGDGPRTVYVRFRTSAGLMSSVVFATTYVDKATRCTVPALYTDITSSGSNNSSSSGSSGTATNGGGTSNGTSSGSTQNGTSANGSSQSGTSQSGTSTNGSSSSGTGNGTSGGTSSDGNSTTSNSSSGQSGSGTGTGQNGSAGSSDGQSSQGQQSSDTIIPPATQPSTVPGAVARGPVAATISSTQPIVFGQVLSAICEYNCTAMTYDLYIVNPDGTERHMDSPYAKVVRYSTSTERVLFEDSEHIDKDYNDLVVEVQKDCADKTISVKALFLEALWHHKIRIKIFEHLVEQADILLWPDSHKAIGEGKVVGGDSSRSECAPPRTQESIASSTIVALMTDTRIARGTLPVLSPDHVLMSLAGDVVTLGIRGEGLVDQGVYLIELAYNGITQALSYNLDENTYTTDVTMPPAGEYEGSILVHYRDTTNTTPIRIRSVPPGIVRDETQNMPLGGVSVSLYDAARGTLWSGGQFGQQNPLTTTASGTYGFVVPNGTYYLVAEKEGYARVQLPSVVVTDNILNSSLTLLPVPVSPSLESSVRETVAMVFEKLQDFADNPMVEQVTKEVIIPVAAAAPVVAMAPALSTTATPLFAYIFLQPVLFVGRGKRKEWGVIYNSLTKLPIDLATVRLVSAETGKVVQSRVTDEHGRYMFSVGPGMYSLQVIKDGFTSPSKLLESVARDGELTDIYHGEMVAVEEEGVVLSFHIPIDPIGADVTPHRVVWQKRMHVIQHAVALSGIGVLLLSATIIPLWYIAILIALQLVVYTLFRRYVVPKKPKQLGLVSDASSGKPLSKTFVRLYDTEHNRLLDSTMTDSNGRYGFLVGPNAYYLTFDRSGFEHQVIHVESLRGHSGDELFITEEVVLQREKKS